MSVEQDREDEAAAVLADFRKGRISATMRDTALVRLGYEPVSKKHRDSWKNPGRNGKGIGAKG